mgnify:CR=1
MVHNEVRNPTSLVSHADSLTRQSSWRLGGEGELQKMANLTYVHNQGKFKLLEVKAAARLSISYSYVLNCWSLVATCFCIDLRVCLLKPVHSSHDENKWK